MTDDVRDQVERAARLHPDVTVGEIMAYLGLDPEYRGLVEDVLKMDSVVDVVDDDDGDDDDESGPSAETDNSENPDSLKRSLTAPDAEPRWEVPLDEQCAGEGCRNQRLHPHANSLCADCLPSEHSRDEQTTVTSAAATTPTRDRPATLAEARAVAGDEPEREVARDPTLPVLPPEFVYGDDAEDVDEDDPGFSLADAMGGGDPALEQKGSDTTTASSGSTLAMPTSALPLAQLDALSPADRRRAAKQRGLDWPSTDEARQRLEDTVFEVMREEDARVVDAPTSLGKTHTVAATRWGARDDVTDGGQVVHLLQTRDARDEAIQVADDEGGDHFVLRARHEACPVAAGDHDPEEGQDPDDDRQLITVDGIPASEWLAEMCDRRGIPFSAAHRALEDANDQDADLPCQHEGDCPAIAQWDDLRDDDHPLVIATHNFAHVPGLRMGTHLVFDEEPDFAQELSTDRVRKAVTAYLQEIDATVQTWEAFIQLSRHDDYQGDAARERDALQDDLDEEPDREWYFSEPRAHTLAPALARAIFNAESRANDRRVGKTPYEPPRLDAGAHEEDAWNRSWLTVVLDESNDVQTVRSTPDLNLTRSVVGLDAHPALPKWQANTLPYIQRREVLDHEERQLWRRYERGLRVVQVGTATRPLASGEYFDWNGTSAVVEHLRETYGTEFRTAITAASVEDELESIMDQAGVRDPELMHYGEEKSRNDFGAESVGFVNGSIDPGDDHVVNLLAELDLEAIPERSDVECDHCEGEGCHECDGTGHKRAHGRAFEGPDAETAQAILASVRENHTAQAAGRYARNPDDPTSTATVFVRTDAMPPGFADVQTPGVVWTFGQKQDRIVEVLREASEPLSAREIATRANCSKEHVRETLGRLLDEEGVDDVHALEGAGTHGATLYAADGVPTSGIVDLSDGIANHPVWDSYTWQLAIHDPPTEYAVNEPGSTTPDTGFEATDDGGGPDSTLDEWG